VSAIGLGHQRHHRGLRIQQRAHLPVVGGEHPGLAGGPEGDKHGVPQAQLRGGAGEELGVLGHRTGPAALDEADAELVEQARHRKLVLHRVGDALGLGAVSQGGVVQVKGVT